MKWRLRYTEPVRQKDEVVQEDRVEFFEKETYRDAARWVVDFMKKGGMVFQWKHWDRGFRDLSEHPQVKTSR